MRKGTVYTETVIWSAPEAFVADVPYQTAIVTLDEGGRVTARIAGDRVRIDDRVEETEVGPALSPANSAVPVFRKA